MTRLTADEQILKEAILDEVDDHRYRLYEGIVAGGNQRHGITITEDFANRERLALADRVIARIRKAKSPETVNVPGMLDELHRSGTLLTPSDAIPAQKGIVTVELPDSRLDENSPEIRMSDHPDLPNEAARRVRELLSKEKK